MEPTSDDIYNKMLSNGSEDLDETKCGPCHLDGESVDAVGMCTTCQDFLCKTCYDGHTLPRPMRNHELVAKGKLQQKKVSLARKDVCTEPCSHHEDEIIKYHCLDHNTLGCAVCITLDHRTCVNVQHIPKVAKDLQNNKTYLDTDSKLQYMQQAFNDVAEQASNMALTLKESSTTAMETFKNFKQDFVEALGDIEKDMEQKMAGMEKDEETNITLQSNKCKELQELLQDMAETVQKLKSDKQNCRLYTYLAQIREKLGPLEDQLKNINQDLCCRTFVFKFAQNEELLNKLKNDGTGNLTLNSLKTTIEAANFTKDIDIRLDTDTASCDIRGCTVLPDNRLIIADYENMKLKTVDVEKSEVKNYIQLFSYPWDIALINAKQLAVTLPKQKRIAFVCLAETPVIERHIDVDGECRGVAFKDDKIALSYMAPYKVEVMTLHGTVLHIIPNNGNIYNRPTYIEFGGEIDTLYVTNSNSQSVIYLKFDGTVKTIYSQSDLQRPRAVITDRWGTVYICTRGPDTVHQLSRDLQKLKVLVSRDDAMTQPSVISYNEMRNELYIGGISETLKVYKAVTKFI